MPKLILVRHGESQWNKANRFTGWTNVSLTDDGIIEAQIVREELSETKFDYVFSSPLRRALDTAKIITNQKIIVDEALKEKDYGDLTGHNKSSAAKKYGDEQILLWRQGYDNPTPNGESLKEVVERVIPFIENIQKLNGTILVISHKNTLRAMLIAMGAYTPEEILKVDIPNAQPIYFNLDGL